jgi:hypothetical protein
MTTTRIIDRYNPNKTWIVKRYPSGNYYINQEICGRLLQRKFYRVTKWQLDAIFAE